MKSSKYKQPEDADATSAPFLWEAPNADAALIFGDKWTELHDYVSNRLTAMRTTRGATKVEKLVSETQPSWMEFMLELMRSRSWTMLYPAQSTAGKWVTVHNELYQVPEEFKKISKKPSKDEEDAESIEMEEPFLLSGQVVPNEAPNQQERPVVQHTQPLHALLPFEGKLPDLPDLPILDFEGVATSLGSMQRESALYSKILRQTIGGCDASEAKRSRKVHAGQTDDLFCFEGEARDYADDDDDKADDTVEPDVVVGETSAKTSQNKGQIKGARNAVDDVVTAEGVATPEENTNTDN